MKKQLGLQSNERPFTLQPIAATAVDSRIPAPIFGTPLDASKDEMSDKIIMKFWDETTRHLSWRTCSAIIDAAREGSGCEAYPKAYEYACEMAKRDLPFFTRRYCVIHHPV